MPKSKNDKKRQSLNIKERKFFELPTTVKDIFHGRSEKNPSTSLVSISYSFSL